MLKRFGKQSKQVVTKELKKLHDMVTYVPMDASKITHQQREEAMQLLMFLTKKQDGRIKSRAWADGSVKRRCPGYKKEDAALPRVSTEAVFITGEIEAHKERVVAYFAIPGMYLHTDCTVKGEKFMLLKGQLAELMVLG